jgi:hypothetical protein
MGKTVGHESVNSIFFPSLSVNDLTRLPLGLTHSPSETEKTNSNSEQARVLKCTLLRL